MSEWIILGGVLIFFWIIVRLGVHYFPPHRQESNAHFIRRAPLTGATEYYKNGQ